MRWVLAGVLVAVAGCANGGGIERRMTGDGSAIDGGAIDTGSAAMDTGPMVDAWAGDPCAPSDTRFCTASCGTNGIASCGPTGVFGPCTPPNEDCNTIDDDCDGTTDEMIAPRACSSACGGGNEQCVSGHWMGCTAVTPGTETCNAMDDDCDSRIDEGITRACATACGSGTERCSAGTFVGCTAASPRTETCNGVDDDCDGMTDELLTRACANACGTGGTETCSGGAYVGCTAPAVPVETCNGRDDDCDGSTDEGLQVTIYDGASTAQVDSFQPSCTGPGGSLDVCLTAAKRWCVSSAGCSIGGAGLLAGNASTVHVVCFGDHASERSVTFAELDTLYGGGTGWFSEAMANSRVASSYVNRWCQTQGFAAGVGPVEHASGMMVVDCLASDQASEVHVATSDLRLAGCDPVADPNTFGCNVAADTVCRTMGMRAGWGPVEWNDVDSNVVCFR